MTTKPGTDDIVYLDKEPMMDYVVKAIRDKTCELEYIYGLSPKNNLTKLDFVRLLKTLKQGYECLGSETTLDIRKTYVRVGKTNLSAVRCTIVGITDIQKYCKTNILEGLKNIVYVRKTNYRDPKNPKSYSPLRSTDYNFRVNLKTEVALDEESPDVLSFKDNLKDSLKSFRFKKRFSFVTSDRLWRIDLTGVKQTSYDYKTKKPLTYQKFSDSNVLRATEEYELEIEYIGSQSVKDVYPIDAYIEKISSADKIQEYRGIGDAPLHNNIFSEVLAVDEVIVNYKGYQIDLQEMREFGYDPGTFDALRESSKRLFPDSFVPPTIEPGDIRYDFWEDSGRENLYEYICDTERTLTFMRIDRNIVGDYKGAPKKSTDYAIFSINPPISGSIPLIQTNVFDPSEEIIDGVLDQLMVPLLLISESSASESLPPINVFLQGILAIEEERLTYDPYGETDQEDAIKKGSDKQRYRKDIVERIVLLLDKQIGNLHKVILETDTLLPQSQINQILRGYKSLTSQSAKTIRFIGPNPVPITLHELLPDNPYTIFHGFVATEKADGIRCQLYITKSKEGYLITQKLKVIDIGLTFPKVSGEWLIDGEYITKDKQGDPTQLFMIFDVYYASDGGTEKTYPQPAYTYPWVSPTKGDVGRKGILEEFKRSLVTESTSDSSEGLVIGFKRYYEGPKSLKPSKKDPSVYQNIGEMGKLCQRILRQNEKGPGYGYEIDGIIFMPMYYPVSALNETPVQNITGPWSINYKWKEARENTIDFRLKVVKDGKRDKLTSYIKGQKTVLCKQVVLTVLYDRKRDPDYDYALAMLLNTREPLTKEIPFHPPETPKEICRCNIPLKDNKMICLKDKTEIQDGMIVEMRYCPDNPEGSQWVPLRHRDDKAVPQLFVHANNIWSTINHPVTEDMIVGKNLDKIPELVEAIPVEESDITYYTDRETTTRDESLRIFHNYVKTKLIGAICSVGSESISIMDTSVGRGGDIGKYLRSKNRVDFLMALDISSNIREAAKRFYLTHKRKPKAMFIQYDTGETLADGKGFEGKKSEITKNQHLLDIAYDRGKQIPKMYRPVLPKYKGLAKKGFDVISCQFSLHYYFKDEITLRNYIQNLSDNCKEGGYFIGTCYDGMKVFQTLKSLPNHTLEMEDEFGNKVYSVSKQYAIEDFTYTTDNKSDLLGQEISVYMNSIGQTISEYLVNFDLFVDVMKEYDFKLATPPLKGKYSGIFDTKALSYTQGFGGFEQILKQLPQMQSNDGDLRNDYKDALEIMTGENTPLRTLSGLNNWFIFQKS